MVIWPGIVSSASRSQAGGNSVVGSFEGLAGWLHVASAMCLCLCGCARVFVFAFGFAFQSTCLSVSCLLLVGMGLWAGTQRAGTHREI